MKFRRVSRKTVFAEYGSGILLKGLSPSQIESIKERLTFQNPQYTAVQKYSRYTYTKVPPYLTYYTQTEEGLLVPAGFDLTELNPVISESRVFTKPKRKYKFLLTLRGSQKEAADAYIRANSEHILRGSIQMPTGKGKSILGLYLASHYQARTLIVVHKDDLVTGWKKDIHLAFGGKVIPGLIKAKSRKVGDFITIATVQTLNKLSPEELNTLYSTFGLVIQDEMHHCPASSFEVVSRFKSRYRLGLTATPERTDGLAFVMNLYFGGFCYVYSEDPEERDEDILPVRVFVREIPLRFDPVFQVSVKANRTVYSPIDPLPLASFSNRELPDGQVRISSIPYSVRPRLSFQYVEDCVLTHPVVQRMVCDDIVREFEQGHSCVVFFTRKEHCRIYYDLLRSRVPEYRLGLYYGDNPDNDKVMEQAENIRQFVTITTYAKATEGTNVKQWESVFLVSSLNNEKNVEQAAGRVRRKKENKLDIARLYDYRLRYAYLLSSHGFTRDKRYKALKFILPPKRKSKSLFSRGYK